MTKTVSLLAIIFLIVNVSFAQDIENKNLSISFSKTTSLIFPFSITSVDRGSQDVLAQKARGVENVLQVKAGRKQFPETNLTVITADGVLHQFTVTYSDTPAEQAITIAGSTGKQSLILVKDAVNERDIQADSQLALKQYVIGQIDQYNKYQMSFSLQEIFIRDNTLYYRIQIRNKSSISYDIKSLKFLIRDRKKVRRTSSQETEINPLYIGNESDRIQAYASTTLIYAMKKFTIPDGKRLFINLFEENGGRHLALRVDNKDILKAKMLPVSKHLLTIN